MNHERIEKIAELAPHAIPHSAAYRPGTLAELQESLDCFPWSVLPSLDEKLRYLDARQDDTWSQLTVADVASWEARLTPLFMLTSFHYNGYIREAAVKRLEEQPDGQELPFLLLRANDWVDEISEAAFCFALASGPAASLPPPGNRPF